VVVTSEFIAVSRPAASAVLLLCETEQPEPPCRCYDRAEDDAMTWKDKMEIGLKNDAPFRKDNLAPDQVHGPEIESGPGRSPVIPEAEEDREHAANQAQEDERTDPAPKTE